LKNNNPQVKVVYITYRYIYVREYRRGNTKGQFRETRVHKTKKIKTKTQHNMCWTPLYESKQK